MPAPRQAGFILVYVAVMLAAIGLILFEIGRLRAPAPLYMEKQIANSLQRREAQLLLDFVEAGLRDQNLAPDPRYLQFKRIIAADSRMPSEMEEQLAWLKAALEQLKFKIDIPGGKTGAGSSASASDPAAPVAMHEGKGILFQPRKDPYTLKIGETEYRISVLPGNALPNLNAVPYDGLWRYLLLLGIANESEARDLAAALVDWRDEDDFSTDGRGAESAYYYGMRPPYPARNAPIRTWQELNYVRGMTPERVVLLRENLMLGPPEATGLWPDAAAPEAFVALTGLKAETVRAILKEYGKTVDDKAANEGVLFTADTAAFDRVVAWKADTSRLRIRIVSPDNTVTADYDAKNKRLVSWW